MKNKLVTSYYPFHNGEPYWGQLNRDRWYKYSLATISNMGEIICYTDPGDKGYNQLFELKYYPSDNYPKEIHILEDPVFFGYREKKLNFNKFHFRFPNYFAIKTL